MFLTNLQQGKFISDGKDKVLKIRSGVDWIKVYNSTNISKAVGDVVANDATMFYWQKGMDDGTAFKTYKTTNAADTLGQTLTASPDGITPLSNIDQLLGDAVAVTSLTNDTLITTGVDHGYQTGDVVRLYDMDGAQQLSAIDYRIAVQSNTTFNLTNAPDMADAAAANGSVRKVIYDTYWKPRSKFITKIAQGNTTDISFSTTHNIKVGQVIAISIPKIYGMTELNGKRLTVTAIDTTAAVNTVTVNINSNNFTAFTYPTNAEVPFSPAMVVPFGENTAKTISEGQPLLQDATYNDGFIGILLAGGTNKPAGGNAETIYWIAGTSAIIDNPEN
jgi:hypothetical protein